MSTHDAFHLGPEARELAAMRARAALLAARGGFPRTLVGFDGFIDVILKAVDQRGSMRREDYVALATIPAFANRIAGAAGKSANIELLTLDRRFGGNGPLLAGALGALGASVTYVGCVGEAEMGEVPGKVHPVFEPFARRCARVIPIAPPATTHALEFGDGKIMFNLPDAIQGVSWESLVRDLGTQTLRELVGSCDLVGVVNWSIMAGVEGVLEGLLRDVLGPLASGGMRSPRLFVDLSDPAKRTTADLARVLGLLASVQRSSPVTLGLNLSEAMQASAALGLCTPSPASRENLPNACAGLASSILAALELACVVVHPREGASAATREEVAWIDGPMTSSPTISTGAGDHFNAGFALGEALGLDISACLAMGVGVSGAYVRDGQSPTRERLAVFLGALPLPE